MCLCVRYPVVGSRRQDSVIGMRDRQGIALCGSRKCKPAPSSAGSVGLTTSLGHVQSLVCAVHSKKCRIKSSLGLSWGSKYGLCMDIHLCRCSSHLSWPYEIAALRLQSFCPRCVGPRFICSRKGTQLPSFRAWHLRLSHLEHGIVHPGPPRVCLCSESSSL